MAESDFAGIAICMHETENDDNCLILPPCKTRKLHTSRRDAFRPVNDKPIARVNYGSNKIEFIKKGYMKKDKSRKTIVRDKFEEKVGLLKCHPNMFPEQFTIFKSHKGLVIEGTGLGQAPVGTPNPISEIHAKNMNTIKSLIKNGCFVIMTSQCIFGRVNMHVYSAAIDLVNAGVVSGDDMLSETALIKLSWLLGNYEKGEVRELISKNLRGEINERHSLNDSVKADYFPNE